MILPFTKRLEIRLIVTVGVGLLLFSLIAAFFTYRFAYRYQLDLADSLQQQLVQTVQVQAEVAAFAANLEIAQGVLNGLLANPTILAARIEAMDGFKAELGSRQSVNFSTGKAYPLFSPVDHIEPIGILVVMQNDDQVNRTATYAALFQTLLMLGQVLATAVIMAIVLRFKLIKPIIRLAEAMVVIQPGSSARLTLDSKHATDEIGLLAKSANTILDAAETAIEEVKAQRNELERLATHDYLTGLPTLRLAEDRLRIACGQARRAQRKVALLYIDLDGFKPINDCHGHDAGDEVLCEVARRLSQCIRAEDTVARIGGDEFLAIIGNLPDLQPAELAAASIGQAIATPINIPGQVLTIGASIGVALFPDDAETMAGLRQAADQAMYQVKKSGKGAFAFINPASAAPP